MVRRLVVSAALAAGVVGGSLFAMAGSVSAQSGTGYEVIVGTVAAAYAVPPALVDRSVFGVEWSVPAEITQGPRGETASMGTYGAAYRMPTLR